MVLDANALFVILSFSFKVQVFNYYLLKLLHYDLQFAYLLPHVFVNTHTV